MAFAFLDSTARSAWQSATSQQAQLEALDALFTAPTLRYYSAAGVHLDTVTHAVGSIATGTDPRTWSPGAVSARTNVTTGTATYVIAATAPSGGTDILRADLDAPMTIVTASRPNLQPQTGGAGLVVQADAGLPAVDTPAWRASMAAWEWKELTGTSLSLTVPSPAPTGNPAFRVDAWNGFVAAGRKLATAGIGGHADYAGNEGYSVDLGAAAPGAWSLLSTPTPAAQYLSDTDYYADDKPTSSHTYYALQYDALRNRIFRFGVGSGWGTGNHSTGNVDAFDLTTNAWDAANAWTDVPVSPGTSKGMCVDPATGNVYIPAGQRLYRWNRSDGSFTALALFPSTDATSAQSRALVFDSARSRVIVVGDGYQTPAGALYFDTAAGTWSQVTLTGSRASDVAAQAGNNGFYLAAIDRIVMRLSPSGGEILLVNPSTWAVTVQTTTGGSSIPATLNGVFGLFQAMPELGGAAFLPRGSSNIWFLATE